ncbi:MAG: hypothetical protein Rhob2KO_29480 [Rhodopirellula baltica]
MDVLDSSEETPTMNSEIALQLHRIETKLSQLIDQRAVQEWYDTKSVAEILGRSAYSVREWCRLGRVNAEKRACGRGTAKEWMISNIEFERIRSKGLLPLSIHRDPDSDQGNRLRL